MLTNPQEIGGKLSSHDETLDYAVESIKWWAKFNAGKHTIEIKHELLLHQGVLSLPESQGENSVDVPKDDAVVEETNTGDKELEKNPSPEALEPNPSKRPQSKKSQSKKKRKAKKQGEAGSAVIQETARKNELSNNNPILTVLSKVIGSPFRIALFSLLLFFWVVSSGPT